MIGFALLDNDDNSERARQAVEEVKELKSDIQLMLKRSHRIGKKNVFVVHNNCSSRTGRIANHMIKAYSKELKSLDDLECCIYWSIKDFASNTDAFITMSVYEIEGYKLDDLYFSDFDKICTKKVALVSDQAFDSRAVESLGLNRTLYEAVAAVANYNYIRQAPRSYIVRQPHKQYEFVSTIRKRCKNEAFDAIKRSLSRLVKNIDGGVT